MKLPFCSLFLASSALLSFSAHAQVIGVKFVDSNDTPFGTAIAGAPGYEQSNWNFVRTDWSGNGENTALFTAGLKDSAGNAVGSTLQNITYGANSTTVHYDSANTWRSGAGNATANDTLMNGYLDDGNDNEPYVNFSLNTGVLENYTVVLYIHGDVANGAVGRYWIEEWTDSLTPGTVITNQVGITSNDYINGTFLQAGPNFSQTATPVNADVASGNYIVFDNLTARNFRIRSAGNGDPEDFGRGPLNAVQIMPTVSNPGADDDGDDLLNGWEVANGLKPDDATGDNGKTGNPDGDGLNNFQEQERGTHPKVADTDADGLNDEKEDGSGTWNGPSNTGTKPLVADTDGDGLLDGVETNDGVFNGPTQTGSNPHNQFSDTDGLPDGWEVTYMLDPNDDGGTLEVNGDLGDPDGDFSNNLQEYTRTTDPRDDDTDDDTIFDGFEDGGGVWFSSTKTGTDPLDTDSDNDTIPDGVETRTMNFVDENDTGTDPNLHDSDDDGYFDEQELAAGTDPTKDDQKPPFPTPIGYWPFDDQGASMSADVSPNGNNATINGLATYVTGHTGLAGDFAIKLDGLDDSATTSLSLSNIGAFTMAGWVLFDTAQANRTGLFGQNDILEFGIIDTDIIHLWSNPGGEVNGTLTPSIEWKHIAFVGDTVSRRVYVNGVEISSGAAATPLAASNFFFNIGGGGIFDATGNFFRGQMDDVAVWDRTLSQKLIANLFSGAIKPINGITKDITISFIGFNTGSNMVTITTENTVPNVSYDILQSLNLVDWLPVDDFQGTVGDTSTTRTFSGPTPLAADAFYKVRAAN